MALIKCPECEQQVSDRSDKCVHCGFPISSMNTVGKVIFRATNDFIGLAGNYTITDEEKNILAKLKPGEVFETKITCNTKFYVKRLGGFTNWKEICVRSDEVSRFSLGMSQSGMGFYVSKVDFFIDD